MLGRLAFRTALDLAVLWDAAVAGITICEDSPLGRCDGPPGRAEAAALDALRAAAEEHARAAGVSYTHVVRRGHAAQLLREEARAVGADLRPG